MSRESEYANLPQILSCIGRPLPPPPRSSSSQTPRSSSSQTPRSGAPSATAGCTPPTPPPPTARSSANGPTCSTPLKNGNPVNDCSRPSSFQHEGTSEGACALSSTSGVGSDSEVERVVKLKIIPQRIPVKTSELLEILIADGGSPMTKQGRVHFETFDSSEISSFKTEAKRGFNQFSATARSPEWSKPCKAKVTLFAKRGSHHVLIGKGEVEFYTKPESRYILVNVDNRQEQITINLPGLRYSSSGGVALLTERQSQSSAESAEEIVCANNTESLIGVATALQYCSDYAAEKLPDRLNFQTLSELFPDLVGKESSFYDEPVVRVAKKEISHTGLYLPSKLGGKMSPTTAEEILRKVASGELSIHRAIEDARNYVYIKPLANKTRRQLQRLQKEEQTKALSSNSESSREETQSSKETKPHRSNKRNRRPVSLSGRSSDEARSTTATERSGDSRSLSSCESSPMQIDGSSISKDGPVHEDEEPSRKISTGSQNSESGFSEGTVSSPDPAQAQMTIADPPLRKDTQFSTRAGPGTAVKPKALKPPSEPFEEWKRKSSNRSRNALRKGIANSNTL